jgi:hypothetical protein
MKPTSTKGVLAIGYKIAKRKRTINKLLFGLKYYAI